MADFFVSLQRFSSVIVHCVGIKADTGFAVSPFISSALVADLGVFPHFALISHFITTILQKSSHRTCKCQIFFVTLLAVQCAKPNTYSKKRRLHAIIVTCRAKDRL
jgi:hypothetical protein